MNLFWKQEGRFDGFEFHLEVERSVAHLMKDEASFMSEWRICFVWIEEVHFELRIWDVLNEWLRLVIRFYWWWADDDHVEDATWMSDGVNVILWNECYDWRKFEFQDKIELNEWWRFEIGVMMVLIGKNLYEERI